MNSLRILVVAEEGEIPLTSLGAALREGGHDVRVAGPVAAADLLASGSSAFDAILRAPITTAEAPSLLDDAERHHIAATLRHTRGNKRQAAHLLGIARSTLLAKVRKYGL